jgi:hypothetical protein
VAHPDRHLFAGGQEGGEERDVADVSAGEGELGERRVVDLRDRSLVREDAPPDLAPLLLGREREPDDEADAAQEGLVEVVAPVRRQDREPAIGPPSAGAGS